MLDPSLPPLELREAQATACLEAAARYQAELLTYARKLSGSEAEGMELFQQTCLNCHDAIQHRGYAGTEYRFYLLTAIRNLHRRTQELNRLRCSLDGMEEATASTPPTDAYGSLADEMSHEVGAFAERDQLALRLHVAGKSNRDIAALLGGHHTWIGKRVNKMKNHLRQAFGRAWANLDAE